jgi:hypothetical protein
MWITIFGDMTPCSVVEFYYVFREAKLPPHPGQHKYEGDRVIIKHWHLSTNIQGVTQRKAGIFTKCSQFRRVPREKLAANSPLVTVRRSQYLHRDADKSLAFPICSTAKRIFLEWVKEVRATKS